MRNLIICLLSFTCLSCTNLKEPFKVIYHNGFVLIPQLDDPYNNGVLYGQTMDNEIHSLANSWLMNMERNFKIDLDSMQSIIHKHTSFYSSIQQEFPNILTELTGIADGAKIDLDLLLALNLGEEIYNFCRRPIEHCSNLAIETKDEYIISYNQDLPDFLHGDDRPIILKFHDYYVFTFPGLVGISGVSKDFAVTCNSLPMLEMNTNGLPLPMYVRKLLKEASHLNQMKNLIAKTPCAIPQNLMICSGEGHFNAEISKNEIAFSEESSLYSMHTNYPLKNKNYKNKNYQPRTCERFTAINNFVEGHQAGQLKSSDIITLFKSPPLQNQETYLSINVSFSKDTNQTPSIYFLNPNQQMADTTLHFK